jgi:hypothetical protein
MPWALLLGGPLLVEASCKRLNRVFDRLEASDNKSSLIGDFKVGIIFNELRLR